MIDNDTTPTGEPEIDPVAAVTLSPEDPGRPAGRRRRSRLVPIVAVGVTMAVVAGAVALLGRDDDASGPTAARRPQLGITGAARGDAASTSRGGSPEPLMMPVRPTRYEHTGPWPALPADALVWRIGGTTDDAAVQRLASAFGIDGPPTRTQTGWTVAGRDGLALTVDSAPTGTWVSVWQDQGGSGAGASEPGSVGGSSGDGSSGTGGATTAVPPDKPDASAPPVPAPVPDAPPITAPAHLPSPADAEARARAILTAAGVLGDATDWRVEVRDGGGVVSIASCAPNANCAPPAPPIVTSRSVTFKRQLDGHDVDGLDWYVEIGDGGRVLGAGGPLGPATELATYPLRSIDAAFADLQAGRAGYPGEIMPLAAARDDAAVPSDVPVTGAPSGTEPAPASEPDADPIVVTIDDVQLAWQVVTGSIDGRAATLVVPMYRFSGPAADAIGPTTVEVMALDPSVVQAIAPTNPVPQPKGIEPQPAPGAPESVAPATDGSTTAQP